MSSQELSLYTLYGLLTALSFGGYTLLVGRLRRDGGRVQASAYGFQDLTFALVLVVFFGLLSWMAFHMPPPKLESISPGQIWRAEMGQIVIVCGVAAYLSFRKFPVVETLGFRRCSLLRATAYAFGLLLLVLPAVSFVSWLISTGLPTELSEEQQLVTLFQLDVKRGQYGGVATIVTTAALLAPAMEEFLFRGFLYPIFKRYGGSVFSAVFTAGLFSLLHGSFAALGGLFVLALALTAAYEWTGSLLVPIGMHALFNSISLSVLFHRSVS